jgi:hypothetical protein
MDARTFEPDEPLPRICKHCRWCEVLLQAWCKHPERQGEVPWVGVMVRTHPDNTCDQWEEKA